MSILKKLLLAGIVVVLLFGASAAIYSFNVSIDVERVRDLNSVTPHEPFVISPEGMKFHDSLRVADWHVDSLMWLRSLLDRSDIGQVDFPRLRDANIAVQVFTSVTRVPSVGIQVADNPGEGDTISQLAFWDKWPKAARDSLLHRSLYHADKLFKLEKDAPSVVKTITNRLELAELLEARAAGSSLIGALLGTEGLQSLEGDIGNVQRLYDAGYRVMGLFHFFDNELGGSLHGMSRAGLSPFGREVISELTKREMIIDVAHASEASVWEVIKLVDRPIILSHTGMRGVCDSERNIPDELMLEIARTGGMIGIAFIETTICEMTPESVVRHLRYAVDLIGVEHVSLGSDYDGSIETPFDVSETVVLTELMRQQGFSEGEIRALMGENILRFLAENLPAN